MTDSEAEVESGDGSADGDSTADADGTGATTEASTPETARDDLVAEVAAHDERLAAEVADLERERASVAAELDETAATAEELQAKLKRSRADFQNYKKRVKDQEQQIRERATADLVERLLDVRDNLVRALEQEEGAEIRDGVEATLASFDRVLADEEVSAIEPEPGQSVEPERHEVVLREEDGEQPPGTIERIYRPGYELAGTVLRPAQVTVSEADAGEE